MVMLLSRQWILPLVGLFVENDYALFRVNALCCGGVGRSSEVALGTRRVKTVL